MLLSWQNDNLVFSFSFLLDEGLHLFELSFQTAAIRLVYGE